MAIVQARDPAGTAGGVAVEHDLALPGVVLDEVADLVAGLDRRSLAYEDSSLIREYLPELRRSDNHIAARERGERADLLTLARARAECEVLRAHHIITDENASQLASWNGIPYISASRVPDDVLREVAIVLAEVDRTHGFDPTTGTFSSA